jgi:hypothetical protein
MFLEFVKIAYELAFLEFGFDYVAKSDTAAVLRAAVLEQHEEPRIRGQIPLAEDMFAQLLVETDKHYAVLVGRVAYIRLFSLAGLIQISENGSPFALSEGEAKVFTFDFQKKTHTITPLLDHFAKLAGDGFFNIWRDS